MSAVILVTALIIISDNVGTTTVPDPGAPHPSRSIGSGTSGGEDGLGWWSTASSEAKLLRNVRDSTNAFGPLKSIAGDLCFILENCEV